MMKKHRFVPPLTDEQRQDLELIRSDCESKRTQNRAHAILLSDKGFTIDKLSVVFEVKRDTVTRWFNEWEEHGAIGLWDVPRPGRPPILNEEEQEIAKEFIDKRPNESKSVLIDLLNETGKKISRKTLSRIAKKYGLTWKRIRRSLKSKRDEEAFKQAEEEIKAFERLAEQGECEVVFFDASGFDLVPSIRSVWQPVGKNTLEVPSFKSERINVIGFLNADDNELTPFVFKGGSIFRSEIIACFENFIENKAKEAPTKKHVNEEIVPKKTIQNEGKIVFDRNINEQTIVIKIDPEVLEVAKSIPAINFEPERMETTVSQPIPVGNIEPERMETTANQPIPVGNVEPERMETTVNQLIPVGNVEPERMETTVNQLIPVGNVEPERMETTVNQLIPVGNVVPMVKEKKVVEEKKPVFDTMVKNPIIVVMDNASVHTSSAFENSIESFQSKGLFPYFLPPYSPELNKIEKLWQKIKYQWLPLEAYQSFTKLTKAVNNILIQYGSEYQINFA
jgi:transposase